MWKRTALMIVLAIPCLALFDYIVLFFAAASTGKVFFRSSQPKGIDYRSYDPYELRAVEGGLTVGFFESHRMTDIWVTKKGSPDYGHAVTVDLSAAVDGVDWKADGIDVHFDSGHRVFIPKRAFIGGR